MPDTDSLSKTVKDAAADEAEAAAKQVELLPDEGTETVVTAAQLRFRQASQYLAKTYLEKAEKSWEKVLRPGDKPNWLPGFWSNWWKQKRMAEAERAAAEATSAAQQAVQVAAAGIEQERASRLRMENALNPPNPPAAADAAITPGHSAPLAAAPAPCKPEAKWQF